MFVSRWRILPEKELCRRAPLRTARLATPCVPHETRCPSRSTFAAAVVSQFVGRSAEASVLRSFVPATGTSTTEHIASLILPLIQSIHGEIAACDSECFDLFPVAALL